MILDPETVTVKTGSSYPEPFDSQIGVRRKRALGDALGLNNYGVNLVELEPGALSAMRHWHSAEDEFVYILEGELVLVTDQGEQVLRAGMVAGFPAGVEDGHHLINRTDKPARYLEVGDRSPDESVVYPDIDLALDFSVSDDFTHKDGTPY